MKIGIASSVYVNYSLQDAILSLVDMGYDGLDIWGGRPHIYRHDYSLEEIKSIKKLLKENNLTAISFMPAFYRYPHSLTSPNEVIRRDSLEYMRICIDNAAELNAGIVLVIPTRSLHGQDTEDARNHLITSIDILCQYANQYNLKLGLEVVNKYLSDIVNTANGAKRLIEELNHQNIGVVLDTGHMNLGQEDTKEAIRTISDNLLQIHVNDNDGIVQSNLVPGDGNYDFIELIEILHSVNYEGFLSAELGYQFSPDPESAVQLTSQRLHRLVQGMKNPYL